jgi:putative ABC transport system substrate-binding protein
MSTAHKTARAGPFLRGFTNSPWTGYRQTRRTLRRVLRHFWKDFSSRVGRRGATCGVEVRWGGGDQAAIQKHAAELVTLAPDVLVAGGGAAAELMLKVTHTIPIVFVIVPDPVGSGFVESLSRPGANATGFMMFDYNLCGKWLELLKEIAPRVTHAAVLRDAGTAAGIGQFAVIQSVASTVGIEVSPIDLREAAQIERVIATFAQRSNGGIILTAGGQGRPMSI